MNSLSLSFNMIFGLSLGLFLYYILFFILLFNIKLKVCQLRYLLIFIIVWITMEFGFFFLLGLLILFTLILLNDKGAIKVTYLLELLCNIAFIVNYVYNGIHIKYLPILTIIGLLYFFMLISRLKSIKTIFITKWSKEDLGSLMVYIIGITGLALILYLRIFLERLPQKITFQFTWPLCLLIIGILCLYFISTILLGIKKLINIVHQRLNSKNNLKTQEENKFLLKFADLLDTWNTGLQEVFEKLLNNRFMRRLCEKGVLLFHKYNKYHNILYWLFEAIPSIIVGLAFLTDLIIFQYFFYLYKSLIILLLPVFYNLILFILNHWATATLATIQDYVTVNVIKKNGRIYRSYTFIKEPVFSEDVYLEYYNIITNFQESLQIQKNKKIKYIKYIFVSSWLYYLFKIIKNI